MLASGARVWHPSSARTQPPEKSEIASENATGEKKGFHPRRTADGRTFSASGDASGRDCSEDFQEVFQPGLSTIHEAGTNVKNNKTSEFAEYSEI